MFSYSKEILAAMNKVYFLLFHLLCFLSFSCKFFKQSFYLATHIIPPDLRNCKDKNARNLIFFHLIFSTPFLNSESFRDSIRSFKFVHFSYYSSRKKKRKRKRKVKYSFDQMQISKTFKEQSVINLYRVKIRLRWYTRYT